MLRVGTILQRKYNGDVLPISWYNFSEKTYNVGLAEKTEEQIREDFNIIYEPPYKMPKSKTELPKEIWQMLDKKWKYVYINRSWWHTTDKRPEVCKNEGHGYCAVSNSDCESLTGFLDVVSHKMPNVSPEDSLYERPSNV